MKRGLSAVALVVIAVAAFELLGFELLKPLENRLLDRFVKAQAGSVAPDPDIVLVDIDEKSLANMQKDAGRWPWPRVVHADLIEGLAEQKPRAIVFDLMFAEADRFRPHDDAAFAGNVRASRDGIRNQGSVWCPPRPLGEGAGRVCDHDQFGRSRRST